MTSSGIQYAGADEDCARGYGVRGSIRPNYLKSKRYGLLLLGISILAGGCGAAPDPVQAAKHIIDRTPAVTKSVSLYGVEGKLRWALRDLKLGDQWEWYEEDYQDFTIDPKSAAYFKAYDFKMQDNSGSYSVDPKDLSPDIKIEKGDDFWHISIACKKDGCIKFSKKEDSKNKGNSWHYTREEDALAVKQILLDLISRSR